MFVADDLCIQYPQLARKFPHLMITESEIHSILEQKNNSVISPNNYPDNLSPCSLIYSSGTTGEPKGILHSYSARSGYGETFSKEYNITADSIVLLTTAAYSNGSWMMILPALYQGATLVIMPKYDMAHFLDILHHKRITHCFLVPTHLRDLFIHDKFRDIS